MKTRKFEFIQLVQMHITCNKKQKSEIDTLGCDFLFEGRPEITEAPDGDIAQLSALGSIGYRVVLALPYINGRLRYTLEREVENSLK